MCKNFLKGVEDPLLALPSFSCRILLSDRVILSSYRVPICLYICIYIINIMYHYSIIGCFRNKFLCKITFLRKEKREIASCRFITFQMMMYLFANKLVHRFSHLFVDRPWVSDDKISQNQFKICNVLR